MPSNEKNAKIARIAGGFGPFDHRIFYSLTGEHAGYWQCRCCRKLVKGQVGEVPQDFLAKDCYKPPPAYDKSLDLLVLVLKKLPIQVWHKLLQILTKQFLDSPDLSIQPETSFWPVSPIFWLLYEVDNPASLLADALIEVIGEEG